LEKYRTPLILFSILLAVALPLVNAMGAHKARSSWPVVKFLIEPYDPRDLLYGHYLRFQITWNWKKGMGEPACQGENCCLCVGSGDYNPEVFATNCPPKGENLPSCTHIIKGSYYGGYVAEGDPLAHNFTTGIDRYYVDENQALPLERLFTHKKEEFAVGLSLSPSGKPAIERLYVAGKTISDYIAAHGGSLPKVEEGPVVDEIVSEPTERVVP